MWIKMWIVKDYFNPLLQQQPQQQKLQPDGQVTKQSLVWEISKSTAAIAYKSLHTLLGTWYAHDK